MIFDRMDYTQTLGHLGRPRRMPHLPHAVLVRSIPGVPYEDVMGPWPYGSVPDADALTLASQHLAACGFVTFTGILRPDAEMHLDAVRRAGFTTIPLKQHFVVDSDCDPPTFSRKTRRNLAIAARRWTINAMALTPDIAVTASQLQADLQHRRNLSAITRMPADHFRQLGAVPGIAVLTASDADGVGAMLIAGRDAGETHLLHFLVHARALRTCASYHLMAAAIEEFGRHGRVYLGGAPAGPDGPGVARFKARWANRTAAVSLLVAILRPDVYRDLSPLPLASYFPAYRDPTRVLGAC